MKKPLFLLALLLLGCQANAPITQADRDAITKQIANFVDGIRTSSADILNNYYSEEAISMPPHTPENSGRQKIVEFHTGPGPKITSFNLSAVEIEGMGNQAYVRGTWDFVGKMDTLQINDNGKFVVLFKKQGTDWKVSREIWNSDLPVPGN